MSDEKEEKDFLLESLIISVTNSKEVGDKIRKLFKECYAKCTLVNFKQFIVDSDHTLFVSKKDDKSKASP
jgi:hypothetical protein